MPKGSRGGEKRGNNDLLDYYTKLNKLHKQRLENAPKGADITIKSIQNAIDYTQQRINELSKNATLDNKKNIIDFVKKQTNIDLTKYIESDTARSRTYLGIHLEKMNPNDRNTVTKLLKQDKGLKFIDNGGLGTAIFYKK